MKSDEEILKRVEFFNETLEEPKTPNSNADEALWKEYKIGVHRKGTLLWALEKTQEQVVHKYHGIGAKIRKLDQTLHVEMYKAKREELRWVLSE